MKRSEILLNELKQKGFIEVDFRFIEEAPEFMEQFRVNSINSLLLEMEGHRPETSVDYSKVAFYEWCGRNNINCEYNAMKRTYLLEFKSRR